MRLTPRRILLHIVIVLVALALPLLLPSSCGPAVRSELRLTGAAEDDALNGMFIVPSATNQNGCTDRTTIARAWLHDQVFDCTIGERDNDGLCEEISSDDADTTANSGGYGYADGYTDHKYIQNGQFDFAGGGLKLLDAGQPEEPEHPDPNEEEDQCSDPSKCEGSPIVIATGKVNTYTLTSALEGVLFDIDADGFLDRIAWTAADAELAFLALDRNGDGIINNGSELFGNYTLPGVSNGFQALTQLNLETNGGVKRGTVSSEDPIFAQLLLWTDSNHNGFSEPKELRPASEIITDIGQSYSQDNRRDGHGNHFRFRGFVDLRTAPGRNKVTNQAEDRTRHRTIYDVFLRIAR